MTLWESFVIPMEKIHVSPTKKFANIVISECDETCFDKTVQKINEVLNL